MGQWDWLWKPGRNGENGQLGIGGAIGASMLPALFGRLLGQNDPAEKMRREFARMMSPQNIAQYRQQFYNDTIQGPGFAMAQRGVAGGANASQNSMARGQARAGTGGSGVGQAQQASGAGILGNQMGGLHAGAWAQAQQQAMQHAQTQAMGMAGMPQTPNYTANLFAGGLNTLVPFLQGGQRQKSPYADIMQMMGGGGGPQQTQAAQPPRERWRDWNN